MEFVIGAVVRSVAGHDKGRFCAVVGTEEKFLLLADGKRRKVETPKRKNAAHVEKTNHVLEKEQLAANGRLRKALSRYNRESDGDPVT